MMSQRQFAPKLYYQLSLDQLVPPNHLLRHIHKAINFHFIYALARPYYSHTGQPSVDPVVIFKTLLIGYLYGITSERRLMVDIQVNLAYRWFLGYDLDEPIYDHSVLSKARVRFGMAIFEKFFEHSIDLCRQAGLLEPGPVFVDSTLVKAAASLESVVQREDVVKPPLSAKEYVQRLYTENPPVPEDNLQSPSDNPPLAAPVQSPVTQSSRRPRLAEDQRRRPRINRQKVSRTDPEASITHAPRSGLQLAYKAHMAVSGKEGRVITAAIATTGIRMDEHLLWDVLCQHRQHTGLSIQEVVADAKYGTVDNYHLLQQQGMTAYIPPHEKFGEPQGKWGKAHFRYIKEQDVYVCPAGKTLRRMSWKIKNRIVYQVDKGTCRSCSLAAQCTRCNLANRDRIATRFIHQDLITEAKDRLAQPEGAALFQKRKTRIEGIFALGKELHGLRRTRFKGKWKVQLQVWLTATVINIKRALKEWQRKAGGWQNNPEDLPPRFGLANCKRLLSRWIILFSITYAA